MSAINNNETNKANISNLNLSERDRAMLLPSSPINVPVSIKYNQIFGEPRLQRFEPLVTKGDFLVSPIERREQAGNYNLDTLLNTANDRGISLMPDVDEATKDVLKRANAIHKEKSIPATLREDLKLKNAVAFYYEIIKPLIPNGKKNKPKGEIVHNLCSRLADGVPSNFVISLCLSKTLSPRRTGSPNGTVDFAELETLKYYSKMVGVAKNLGLPLGVIFMDESTTLPDGGHLGITNEHKKINKEILTSYLEKAGTADRIQIRSLKDSVEKPLGSDFPALYEEKYQQIDKEIRSVIANPNQNDECDKKNKSVIETHVFFDLIPDKGLKELGVPSSEIDKLRDAVKSPNDLSKLPKSVLDYVIHLTANTETMLKLREAAGNKIASDMYHQYPEYNLLSRIKAGITRSEDRDWNFMPHPIRYEGNTILAMHGLGVYDGKGIYLGNLPYKELTRNESSEIMYIGGKPVGAIMHKETSKDKKSKENIIFSASSN